MGSFLVFCIFYFRVAARNGLSRMRLRPLGYCTNLLDFVMTIRTSQERLPSSVTVMTYACFDRSEQLHSYRIRIILLLFIN